MDFLISPAYAQSAAAAAPGGMFVQLLPILIMLPLLWFVIIRPQQKRMKEHRDLIESLKKGDEIVTTGGIAGKITNKGDAFVTIRVAEGVEINVQQHAVANVLPNGTLKSLQQ